MWGVKPGGGADGVCGTVAGAAAPEALAPFASIAPSAESWSWVLTVWNTSALILPRR